jgi:hypothetical protein
LLFSEAVFRNVVDQELLIIMASTSGASLQNVGGTLIELRKLPSANQIFADKVTVLLST